MRILVTGASGLLGLNLCLMQAPEHTVIGIANQTKLSGQPFSVVYADLTGDSVFKEVLDKTKPELVINCAAMAVVDQCENLPAEAERINAWLPGKLAEMCAERDVAFIHISTDAVFDGKIGGYTEEGNPNPLSVYARTKLLGEQLVLDANVNALIARVNFYGYSVTGKRSLAEFFLFNLIAGIELKGFTDVVFSPLYVKDLVDILFKMHAKGLSGLYHVVSSEKISKYDFGLAIAARFSLEKNLIKPISSINAGLKAKRSPNLFLNIDKLLDKEVTVPGIGEGVDTFYQDYQNKLPTNIRSYLV